jgi:pyrroloquinoline quinone biosynthesis protein B
VPAQPEVGLKLLMLGNAPTAGTSRWPPAQRSLALSETGERWLLLNASPDLGSQLRTTHAFEASTARSPRSPHPIQSVVLMDAHIEHVAGLLALREGPPLQVHATPAVYEDLCSSLPLLQVLQPYCGVRWHLLAVGGDRLEAPFRVAGFERTQFTAVAMAGTAPPHSSQPQTGMIGHQVAIHAEDVVTGQSVFVLPARRPPDARLRQWMNRSDCVLVDLHRALPPRRQGGMATDAAPRCIPACLQWLGEVDSARKILLDTCQGTGCGMPCRQEAEALTSRGIEVAHDGMEIEL